MDDDWDLQAVVRGCAAAFTTTTAAAVTTTSTATTTCSTSTDMCTPLSSFFQPQQHDDFPCFPDLFEPRRSDQSIEELHDLCKPFFPKLQPLPISPFSALGGLQDLSQQKQLQTKQSVVASTATATATTRQNQSPRSKKRKNQMKKVCQVPAEGLSSDMWSWRKYGQKPIKGSPYPRGYYRCSTSKGCLARKQVERNRSDPTMFIVTYTGEHNHPMPTHRNSLAGSTRQKPVASGDASKPSCSPPVSPAASLSPATEKVESMEEEDDDDFFEGLEEIAGGSNGDGFSDHFPASLPFPWFGNSATTTAAGGG